MTSLHNSLAQVASGYSVFEKDQVLTEAHLNSVSNYLDDQDRLSRLQLTGVGIVCGLQVQLDGAQVRLSPGTGITSDGDLVQVRQALRFTAFKTYDTQAPAYPPLYRDATTMVPAFQLLEDGDSDPLAQPLAQLPATAGQPLSAMTAVLLVESYIKDSDLCGATDCDNRGQDYVSTNRLLLVPAASLGALLADLPDARAAAAGLPQLTTRRVTLGSSVTSSTQLNARFVSAANAMLADLVEALALLWPRAGFVLDEVFSGDPVAGWITRLEQINSGISSASRGAQYYYDFLKDLLDTWNDLRRLMASDMPLCLPQPGAFAKHLLLGDLGAPAQHRFGFWPSPAVTDARPRRQVQFLAQKLDAMLNQFELPPAGSIRVTPSRSGVSLEGRAIPAYYRIDTQRTIVRYWSFEQSARAMELYNYGYHASRYGGRGGAANPLQSCIDGFDFFRVEGHIGAGVESALQQISQEIETHNLPFAVTSVFLGSNRNGIIGRRGSGYTDLNRFHYLLRQDVAHSLDDVSRFNDTFKAQVDQAVSAGTVVDDLPGADGTSVTQISDSRHAAIQSKAATVKTSLNQSYQAYRADSGWKTQLADTITSAGEYKLQLAKVVKTEYATPFDNLMGSVKVDWLDLLDAIIDGKDEERDNRRLLREFIRQYPGLEHRAGSGRGGTLVLVYDGSGTVVADLCLSHYLVEEAGEAEEPELPKPGYRPPWVIDHGITLQPSLDNVLIDKLDVFKLELDQEWTSKFDLQTTYTNAFQESLGLINNLYGQQLDLGDSGTAQPGYQDALLGLMAENLARERTIVEEYRSKVEDTTLPPESRDYYRQALEQKEQAVARSTAEVADYMSANDVSVGFGDDGYRAMQEISGGLQVIRGNSAASEQAHTRLTEIRNSTGNSGLAQGLGAVVLRG